MEDKQGPFAQTIYAFADRFYKFAGQSILEEDMLAYEKLQLVASPGRAKLLPAYHSTWPEDTREFLELIPSDIDSAYGAVNEFTAEQLSGACAEVLHPLLYKVHGDTTNLVLTVVLTRSRLLLNKPSALTWTAR